MSTKKISLTLPNGKVHTDSKQGPPILGSTHLCSSSSESDKDPAHGMTTLRTQLRIVSETMHSAHSLPKTDQPSLGPLPNGTRRPESFLLAAVSEPSSTFTLKPLVPVAKELESPSSLLPSPLFFFCALQMSQLSLAERQEIVKLIYIPPSLKTPSPSPSIPALASLPKVQRPSYNITGPSHT
ncbi:unnamed protein product [Prunus armeniaca]|uniref:Uncharacterized protein n=1 Tax=Prunus armeniaca TaxID=36596 RepID=A0A6J5XZQ0_PRUAR|nr:unnamed protein product [Prunus armeniaca]